MKKVLLIVAHPHLEKSRVNLTVSEAVADLPGVEVRSLYDLYPRFHIQVSDEQRSLEASDLVIVQFPFYWFNMPPLLKLWQDQVLEYDWAYGPNGHKLRGKGLLVSTSTGGAAESFQQGGRNQFEMKTLLLPWQQTAQTCGMNYLEPLVFHQAIRSTEREIYRHAERVKDRIRQLQATEVRA